MSFPHDFVWGTATASYQIEGSVGGGRGECIWHTFSHTPGKVANGDTGDVACDHLHRYREDVALMRQLGLGAYRFSTAWARVIPNGTGAINPAGLDFYDSLVDALLEAGITPYLTLYHWDLPQALQDRGGWENPDSIAWFTDYTRLMAHRLGDRVKHWMTLNEPLCIAFLGNLLGIHAPGKRDAHTAYLVAHHLLRSHGASAHAIRSEYPDAEVGIAINMNGIYPATDDPLDLKAAQYQDGVANRWFLDPLVWGRYPQDIVDLLGPMLDGIVLDQVREAAVPLDFMGLNYYNRDHYAWDDENPIHVRTVPTPNVERTAMGWEIYPESLTEILVRLHRDYRIPALYVTENGAAFDDPAPSDGIVEDPRRVEFLRKHFSAAGDAIAQGAPVRGYFVWSLLDNFEWAEGYSKRFGIIHVDFETQKRTLKRSALYYRDLIAATKAMSAE